MEQLDLFKNLKKISRPAAKYERTFDWDNYDIVEEFRRTNIYCECKRYVKLLYKTLETPHLYGQRHFSPEDYLKNMHIETFYCPYCGIRLRITGVKIKFIELEDN